jgi:hypothetical protein
LRGILIHHGDLPCRVWQLAESVRGQDRSHRSVGDYGVAGVQD